MSKINNIEDKIDYFKLELLSLEEIESYALLIEARTKEQQEAGQREMAKLNAQPFEKLRNYLIDKWDNYFNNKRKNNEKITSSDLLRKKLEFSRFNELLRLSCLLSQKTKENLKEFSEKEVGTMPQWLAIERDSNSFNGVAFTLDKRKTIYNVNDLINVNGFLFDKPDDKLKSELSKFILLHEYGHFYEWLKDRVETGNYQIVDTEKEKDINKIIDSEGKANSFAINSMYRKDRRDMLKKVKSINLNDEYIKGTKKHCKELKNIVKSIDKENKHFNY